VCVVVCVCVVVSVCGVVDVCVMLLSVVFFVACQEQVQQDATIRYYEDINDTRYILKRNLSVCEFPKHQIHGLLRYFNLEVRRKYIFKSIIWNEI
jgi:hypothetical protein